ncbi:MAG: SPOR domain-containing protein [Steroidobacteraceae bacterium]
MTGALILVALFVIVVPEMLTGPARRTDRAAPAAAPADPAADDGPPVRSYTMELGDVKVDQSALVPQSAATPQPAPQPAAAPPEPAAPPVAQAVQPPAVAAEARPSLPPVSPPAPSARPAPAAKTASAAAWWVQVGSFSQAANARRIERELSAVGIAAQVSSMKSKGKELFRVRAGPVADRQAAEALQQRLAAAGHKGSLVAP